MIGSILMNYFFALKMEEYIEISNKKDNRHRYAELKHARRMKKTMLVISVIFNLLLLGIFKYTDFTIGNLNTWFGLELEFTTTLTTGARDVFKSAEDGLWRGGVWKKENCGACQKDECKGCVECVLVLPEGFNKPQYAACNLNQIMEQKVAQKSISKNSYRIIPSVCLTT